MHISIALASLRPGAEWACKDGTYAGLDWRDLVQTKPTEAEVTAELARLESPPPLTPEEKLATATGLTVAELKALVASGK